MSVVKRIIRDNIERLKVDELLADEYEQAGYGGITLTKTPLGAQINLYAMRPGRVIGRRGRAIKAASARLEEELGISNPQITVVEVEVPELSPRIMASRIANALERGVHYRRSLFWALRRIMESGALGCEIVIRGKLRSNRSRFEKVTEGYMPKSGDPVDKYLKSAIIHVKLKKGIFGITVTIVPPDAKFPDKVSLEGLPEIEVPEEEKQELPQEVEAEVAEAEAQKPAEGMQPVEEAEEAPAEEGVEEPIEEAEPEQPEPEPEEAILETDVEPAEETEDVTAEKDPDIPVEEQTLETKSAEGEVEEEG